MVVDLNDKELFALVVLVNTDNREKKNKQVDVAFEECLEMKLVEALLKETGKWPPAPPIDKEAGMRLIEEHRLMEEHKG